jgi:hypothetical protein
VPPQGGRPSRRKTDSNGALRLVSVSLGATLFDMSLIILIHSIWQFNFDLTPIKKLGDDVAVHYARASGIDLMDGIER